MADIPNNVFCNNHFTTTRGELLQFRLREPLSVVHFIEVLHQVHQGNFYGRPTYGRLEVLCRKMRRAVLSIGSLTKMQKMS